jgi:precorrin-6y C5,15-methyltransferase (decarboxylating) CbiE subunit
MKGSQKVAIIGCGPGSPSLLTDAAREEAQQCDLLAGSPRLLSLFPGFSGRKMELRTNYGAFVEDLPALAKTQRIGVLVSGDPGVHSLARLVIRKVGPCTVIPGISSVQLAFARLGLPWQGACIVSFHDREPELPKNIDSFKFIVFLTDGESGPCKLGELLSRSLKGNYTAWLCENLSLPDESITRMTIEELRAAAAKSLNLVILMKEGGPGE